MDKIKSWFFYNWKQIATCAVIVCFSIGACNISFLEYRLVPIAFAFLIVCLLYLLYMHCKKDDKLSILHLISLNIVSMIFLFESSKMIFQRLVLGMIALFYIVLVILGLGVVWEARRKHTKKFNSYLIISLLTVILNFGGFYNSLYCMFFPYGFESFSVDQEMSWSQAVMPKDFIYYSADAFFGTDLSNVDIRYLDYMDLHKEDGTLVNNSDKFEYAELVVDISKAFSLIESILFIVYISMIIMGSGEDDKS